MFFLLSNKLYSASLLHFIFFQCIFALNINLDPIYKKTIFMKKKLFAGLSIMIFSLPAFSQKTFDITVVNDMKSARKNAPVVLKLKDYASDVKSALVTHDNKEIPCQLDDLDLDGVMDELCFITDIDKKASEKFSITLYNEGTPKVYDPEVYVEMLLSNKKIKESNKQNLYISHLTVDNGVNPYWMIHHHGVAFENEMVAYRIYFDHRQTMDIYGKYNKGLELKQTQFYPDQEQKNAGFGDDVPWVGSTLGAGTLRGWDGKQPVMLTDVDKRSQRIISRGPLRTIVEVKDKGWTVLPGQEPIDMTALYTLYAGRRNCDISVKFSKPATNHLFATGLINVKNSIEYSDGNGLRGCWGTDWPVSEKDSAGHKRETVGLGICIPKEYIVSEEAANKDNYAYVIKTDTDHLNYSIAFCSDNETFGFHSDKEWYEFLKEWKEETSHPLIIKR